MTKEKTTTEVHTYKDEDLDSIRNSCIRNSCDIVVLSLYKHTQLL